MLPQKHVFFFPKQNSFCFFPQKNSWFFQPKKTVTCFFPEEHVVFPKRNSGDSPQKQFDDLWEIIATRPTPRAPLVDVVLHHLTGAAETVLSLGMRAFRTPSRGDRNAEVMAGLGVHLKNTKPFGIIPKMLLRF